MNLREYVSQYKCCAINDIPDRKTSKLIVDIFPDLFDGRLVKDDFRKCSKTNIRFFDGEYWSNCVAKYHVGDCFNCESVISFTPDLLEEDTMEETYDLLDLM